MRKLLVLLLFAACTSDRPSASDLVPCGASWGLDGDCEPACAAMPAQDGLGCADADNPIGGQSSCQRTFEDDGTIGCCRPDTDGNGRLLVRFWTCQ